MAVTGFLFPTTDTAVSGSWTNPTFVQSDNGSGATVLPGKNTTVARDAGGFGFSIPAGSLIVKVELKAKYLASVNTSIATFRFNANVGGAVLANHDDATEPTSYQTTTFDITADRTWAVSDFADGTFFVRFQAVQGNSSTAVTFNYDYVSAQVTYIPIDETGWRRDPIPPTPTRTAAAYAVAIAASGMFGLGYLPPVPGSGDVSFVQSNSPVPYQQTLIYQSLFNPVPVVTAETVTVDKWFSPLSQPTPRKALPTADQQFTAFVRVDENTSWLRPLSEPVRITRRTEGSVSFVATVAPPAETITPDKWFAPLSTPVRLRGLPTYEQPSLSFVKAAPFAETVTADRWVQPLSQPVRRLQKPQDAASAFVPVVTAATPGTDDVRFVQGALSVVYPKTILYQSTFDPIRVAVAAETVTVDKWFSPLSNPPSGGFASIDLSVTFSAVEPSFGWYRPFVDPVRRRGPSAAYLPSLAFVAPVITPETVTSDKWFRPLNEPVRLKRATPQQSLAWSSTEIVTPDKWFAQLSQPVLRRGLPAHQQPALAFVKADPFPETVTADRWVQPLSVPSRGRALPTSEQPSTAFVAIVTTAETITPDKWFRALSEPVRRGGLLTADQQALAFVQAAPFAEAVSVDRWLRPLSEPVRVKRQGVDQTTALVAVLDRLEWFRPLVEPVRVRNVQQGGQVFVPIVAPSEVVTVDKWFASLSIPVRARLGLPTYEQQSLAFVKAAPFGESVTVDRWQQPLSQPTRRKVSVAGYPAFTIDPVALTLPAAPEPPTPTPTNVIREVWWPVTKNRREENRERERAEALKQLADLERKTRADQKKVITKVTRKAEKIGAPNDPEANWQWQEFMTSLRLGLDDDGALRIALKIANEIAEQLDGHRQRDDEAALIAILLMD